MLQNRREGSVRSGLPTLKLFTTESREDSQKSYATLTRVKVERSGLRTKKYFGKASECAMCWIVKMRGCSKILF